MAQNATDRRERRLALVAVTLILAGFFLRLALAAQPPERLIPLCLADDAFYYLRIAENILAGNGSTFDGVAATNGYHPLWMLVSMAAVRLAGSAVPAARLLTLALAVIGAGNAFLLWRLALRVSGPVGGAWAAGFWALSPFAIFTELMGVEAPLMILFVLATLLAYLPLRSGDPPPKKWLPVGLLLGLALLARTDAILFAFALAVDVVVAHWLPARRNLERLRRRVVGAVAAAGVAVAVVSPWVVFSLARFGTVTQGSFTALIYTQRKLAALTGDSAWSIFVQQLNKGVFDFFLRFTSLPGAPLAVVFLAGLAVAALTGKMASGTRVFEARERGAAAALLWGATVWAFYVFYFWQQKMWYFLPAQILLALATALLLGYLDRVAVQRRLAGALALTLAAGMAAGFARTGAGLLRNGFHDWQKVYLDGAATLRQMAAAEPGLRAAAFNSGIESAFSGLPVIDLDGVVNPDAARAIREKKLLAYLRSRGVNVVVDHLGIIAMYEAFAEPEWRNSFTMVRRFPTPPSADDVVILRVRPVPAAP